jgi:transporter family-2 protein
MVLLYLLFAFAAGVALPFQAGVNAELAHWIDSPIRAAFVSFAVGAVALLLISLPRLQALALDRSAHRRTLVGVVRRADGRVLRPRGRGDGPTSGAATLIALVVAGQSPRRSSSTISAWSASTSNT